VNAPHPDWLVPEWRAPARVKALVTTRAGGVSRGPYAALNLSERVGDDPFAVEQNRAILRAMLPHDPVWLHQEHGTDVVDAAAVSSLPRADSERTLMPAASCRMSRNPNIRRVPWQRRSTSSPARVAWNAERSPACATNTATTSSPMSSCSASPCRAGFSRFPK
jgi:hypothetical protein